MNPCNTDQNVAYKYIGFPYLLLSLILFFKLYLFICLFVCLFIYLFLAVLGLHCCVWAFSSCGKWRLLFVAVHGLLIVVASLVKEHRL